MTPVILPSAAVKRSTCHVTPSSERYTKSERQERPGVSARWICAAILLERGTSSDKLRQAQRDTGQPDAGDQEREEEPVK
jgi:hypothetical protein